MKNKQLFWAIAVSLIAIAASIQLQNSTIDADKPLPVSDIAEQYVKLALSLGEHEAGYIDAYYGPKEWQSSASDSALPLASIITQANNLQHHLSFHLAESVDHTEIEQLRLSYLEAQLKALVARTQMNSGNMSFTFDEETQALFDTQAPKYAWSHFEITLNELDRILPGEGALIERVDAFREDFVIPQDKLKLVFDAAIDECRERTKKYVALPDSENFTLEFVQDKPWSGYNWYKGDSFSLIQVNTELPINISRAIDLGCHEGYPGHHTYNGLLESNLYNKRGWVEFSVYPLFSPQSLIAEGSANYGIEMAFPEQEKIEFEQKVLFPLAGLDTSKVELYSQVSALTSKLSYAGNEVARKYLNKEIEREEAETLLQQYALMSPKKSQQRVRFMDTYGSYVINYNWGKDLVKEWVESDSSLNESQRWQKFSELLSTPRLPSTLK